MKRAKLISGAVWARRAARLGLPLALCAAVVTSCIDEDLSRCGVNYMITYNIRLTARLHAAIQEALPSDAEQQVAAQLETAMTGEWGDKVHDLDLSFFDNHNLSYHQNNIIDAASASLTLYMRQADYRHLALANATGREPVTAITSPADDRAMAIVTADADTIPSHAAPMYSARLDMSVENVSRTYHADLYMLNSMVGVVLADGGHASAVEGYVSDVATAFAVNDSVYSYARTQLTRMNGIAPAGYRCLYATCMPSRDAASQTSQISQSSQLSRSGDSSSGLWRVKVYVTVGDKITENILSVSDPLQAGGVKIIKGIINPDGSITTESPEVGVSVTLDWKPGGEHDVEI